MKLTKRRSLKHLVYMIKANLHALRHMFGKHEVYEGWSNAPGYAHVQCTCGMSWDGMDWDQFWDEVEKAYCDCIVCQNSEESK